MRGNPQCNDAKVMGRNNIVFISDMFKMLGRYCSRNKRNEKGGLMKNKFKVINFTTIIPKEKTLMEIEQMLALFGASAIMKEYLSDGTCSSLSFKLGDKGYKLPANVQGVNIVLTQGKKIQRNRTNNLKHKDEQAERVAWRIVKDWLHAQLSIIASGQAEPEQVMLPYLFNGKETMWERYKAGKLKNAIEGNSESD